MLERGTVIAGYRIERMLGAGGMGVVYEATQVALGRTVALKFIAAGRDADPIFLKRFRREGQAQGALDHPHIVPVYEAGETEGGLFLAMRLVRGPTLKDMIVSRELDAGRALRILEGVADALDTAHAAGLVHRDVKPQNILVASRDHPYLADFGLTQATGATSLTDTGMFVGTFDYISPEQISGDTATPACDIYALAGVLYECLTGVVPYPKRSRAAVIYAHLSADPPSVSDQRPELPEALDRVIARGLAKEPADRPDTAKGLIAEARHAFDRRLRAAIAPPGPIDSPEETGIQRPEADVTTDPSRRPAASGTEAAPTSHMPTAGGTSGDAAQPSMPMPAPSTPEGSVAAASGPSRGAFIAAGVAAVLVMVLVGTLLGSAGGDDETRAEQLPNTSSSADFELGFDDGWRRTADGANVPGLDKGQRIALASSRGTGGLVATMTQATGPALLPRALLDALPDRPASDAVKLGDLEALRYRALRPRGTPAPIDVYAVPTDRGVMTVACQGAAAPTREDCGSVAATLTLLGPEAFDLGPDADYAKRLGGGLTALDRAVRSGTRRLDGARTPRDQAAAAALLERAYGGAAGRARRLRPPPMAVDANRNLADALFATRDAYGDLSAAARRNSRRRYRRAAAGVERRQAKVAAALDELRKLGYESGT